MKCEICAVEMTKRMLKLRDIYDNENFDVCTCAMLGEIERLERSLAKLRKKVRRW